MCTFAKKLALVSGLGLLTAVSAVAQQPSHEWQVCNNSSSDNDARIAACTDVLNKGPREPSKQRANAFNDRGLAFANKAQNDRAIQDFDDALHLDPQNAIMYSNRGWAFTNKGDADRALRDLDEAIRLNPKLAIAYNNRGRAYSIKADHDRAIADFGEAIRLDPKMAGAFNGRGNSYNNKGEYDRAIQDLDEALRLNPKYSSALTNRGRSYTSKGAYDRGLQDLDEAIRLDPKMSVAFNNRGWTYNNKHEYDRALADLDESIRLDPNNGVARLNRSISYNSKHDYDRAIADLDQSIRLMPTAVNAWVNRGQNYTAKGDYDRAIHDLDEALRLAPRSVAALNGRGFAYKQKGEFDRAIRDLDEAIRLDPKFVLPYSNRGDAYRLKGDSDRAIADLSEAIRLDPKIMPAYAYRGLAYEQQGNKDRAILDFKAVLSMPRGTYVTADWAMDKAKERLALLGATAPTQVVTAPPPVVTAPPPSPRIATAPPAVPSFGRRVALVVGNSEYRYAPRLANPTNDESDFANVLRQLGFDVVAGANLDRHGMDDAIREFGRKLDGADLALFFYAGHGLQVGGRNYLVPVDAKLERAGDLALDAVDISAVLAQMEAEKRVNLVFLDACRDNPLARSLAGSLGTRGIAVGTGLASVQSAIGTMIVYATQPDNVALDGAGRNSPFTAALLKHIATPNVEIGTIMRRVRADVVAATRERQVPWDHSSLIGEVILAR
jgi:tetratricopeptide (TPR) repeat protein